MTEEGVRKLREYAGSGRRAADGAEEYLRYYDRVPKFEVGDEVDYFGVPVRVEEVLDAWGPSRYTPYTGRSPHGYDYAVKVLRRSGGYRKGRRLQLSGTDLERCEGV